MSEPSFGQVLRWRLASGNYRYLQWLVTAVGCVLSLTYIHVAIVYRGGENPWSLLAPVLALPAIGFFVVGWTYAKPLPYLVAIVLTLVGGVLPFALIG